MVDHRLQTQHSGSRAESDTLSTAGAVSTVSAVRLAVMTVGGWLAATIFLLTISGALPAAVNKICRSQGRSMRITCSLVPLRVDRRVDVIEPDHGPRGLTAEQIREDEDFASAEAATIAAAQDDQHRAKTRRNLPYRAAPFLARADLLGPSERHLASHSHASPDASLASQPASFPPRFNRPPPFSC
jgi:hypothetical protein